jgi:hypothetical protein
MPYLKTAEVARKLGVNYCVIIAGLRNGKFPPPAKDSSGDYVWTPADVDRARQGITLDRRRRVAV